jgi:hypothetical protein
MANSENLLRRLRTTLDRPDTVLLIGSGTSLWSGLPTWEKLLIKLAEFVESLGRDATAVRQEIKVGDLLLAASYAVHQLDLREFGAFIRQAANYPNAKPAEIHHLIATLGPSCFITTNYDRLLETAFAEFGPHCIPSVVTNRQVAEIADILPSYARRFIFKYHGDVEDAASIVLTRDQYRRIQHEYPATTRAFETLLATRPVVMIGFGLRDLDFLAVKDELVAAFEGQVGEYFAVMPDFDNVRTEYWRKTYRTEIISYETTLKSDGSRDHSNLLQLLRKLQPSQAITGPTTVVNGPSSQPSPSDFTLQLARLAATIVRKKPAAISEFLPLTVSTESTPEGFPFYGSDFYGSDLSRLLKSFEHNFLLLGPPGSGKTFALANYAADLANILLQQCIQEQSILNNLHIPIIAHLAVYAGDLRELIQGTLPTGLDFSSLLENERCTLILDGVNETPREFIENGKWLNDFQELISSAPKCRFILGSRNETWLSSLDLKRFSISDIDSDFVGHHFSSIGKPEVEKNPELIRTLSKPLFFALASSDRIDLSAVATPADVYATFFSHLDEKWRSEGQRATDFATVLESVAFGMLEAGAEFAAKEQFESALQSSFPNPNAVEKAISFLLAQGALLALAGHRLAFFHQSVTEYLAARIIAHQFVEDRKSLRVRLQDKRWDQALFLAMGFLDEDVRRRFLDEILRTDLAAAARAAHYIEVGQERVINEILERATKLRSSRGLLDFSAESRLEHQLERLPYTGENVDNLRCLSKRRGPIGGVGAGGLFRVEAGRRNIILGEVLRKADDWNYIQTFVRVSKSCWSADNFEFLIEKLLKKRSNTDSLGIFGELIYELVPLTTIFLWCASYIQRASAVKYVLIEAIHCSDSRAARSILLDLVSAGEGEAIYPLYSNLDFHCNKLESDELPPDPNVAKSLIRQLHSEYGGWAVSLARKLIEQHTDWKDLFRPKSKQDAETHLLSNIILSEETSLPDLVATTLENIAEFDGHALRILGDLEFWKSASSTLALDAICTRNPYLASAIMQQIQAQTLPMLSARELDWWLDWGQECFGSKVDPMFWCGYRISQFLNNGDEETRAAVLARFNGESEAGFKQIGQLVFQEGAGRVTTDQFSKIAIDRLLNRGQEFQFSSAVLGHAATEEFVKSVMLPHLTANPRYFWVRKAIEIAGDRHNRRYLVGEMKPQDE